MYLCWYPNFGWPLLSQYEGMMSIHDEYPRLYQTLSDSVQVISIVQSK